MGLLPLRAYAHIFLVCVRAIPPDLRKARTMKRRTAVKIPDRWLQGYMLTHRCTVGEAIRWWLEQGAMSMEHKGHPATLAHVRRCAECRANAEAINRQDREIERREVA